jgi:cysteine desulfurase
MDSLRSGNRPGTGRRCLWHELQERFGNRITLNGHPAHRLPNTLNVSFVNCIGAEIEGARRRRSLNGLGVPCRAHRALARASSDGSHAGGGMGAIRFSLGRGTTREEIDAAAERLSRLPTTAFMTMSAGKPAE